MIVEPFAGPGGWDEGLRTLGRTDVIGIELDAAACATRAAAGHRTIRADVADVAIGPFAGKVEGLIASPPCQSFSLAGNGEGRKRLVELADAILEGRWWAFTRASGYGSMLDVGEWVCALRPRWVACEQVPPVLPMWRAYADLFGDLGYRCWTGILNAADFGVPQTRDRAFLLASLDGPVLPPEPTHARHPQQSLFGPERRPWVSMAAALGWPDTWEVEHQRGRGMAARHGERPARPAGSAAPTVTAGAGRQLVVSTGANSMKHSRDASDMVPYERPITEPAPTLDAKVGGAWQIGPEGHRQPPMAWTLNRRQQKDGAPIADERYGDSAGTEAIRLTIAEALILQSFPPDYPVQGTKTKQFEQVGNAVPPRLAAHVLASVVGSGLEAAA